MLRAPGPDRREAGRRPLSREARLAHARVVRSERLDRDLAVLGTKLREACRLLLCGFGEEAGEGEEDFEDGMRQNAMERDAADADNDGKLDFGEFCVFVRDREEGEFTDEELKARFDALDGDGSGKVDMAEYLLWSLKDALARSSQRVVDLFRAWDEDGGGTIDKDELKRDEQLKCLVRGAVDHCAGAQHELAHRTTHRVQRQRLSVHLGAVQELAAGELGPAAARREARRTTGHGWVQWACLATMPRGSIAPRHNPLEVGGDARRHQVDVRSRHPLGPGSHLSHARRRRACRRRNPRPPAAW